MSLGDEIYSLLFVRASSQASSIGNGIVSASGQAPPEPCTSSKVLYIIEVLPDTRGPAISLHSNREPIEST